MAIRRQRQHIDVNLEKVVWKECLVRRIGSRLAKGWCSIYLVPLSVNGSVEACDAAAVSDCRAGREKNVSLNRTDHGVHWHHLDSAAHQPL